MNRSSLPTAGLRLFLSVSLAAGCGPFTRTVQPGYDGDGDGFLDGVDQCLHEPGVAPDGCPIPDSDADGIWDPDDKCPTVPENRNGYQDEDGCPDEIPRVLRKFTGTIKGIYFDTFKATIKPKSKPVLDRAVAVMKEFDTLVIGIACYETMVENGGKGAAILLTLERAMAIKKYLVDGGVAPERIGVRGIGEDKPEGTDRATRRDCIFTILVDKKEIPGRRYEGPMEVEIRTAREPDDDD